MKQYPYIADKTLYAAVMFACKMIRQKGTERAANIAADYYGISEKRVLNELKKRQSAGKEQSTKKIKYNWYIVQTQTACDAEPVGSYSKPIIKRATCKENAKADWSKFNARNDYGGSYAPYKIDHILGEYSTKREAENALEMMVIE